MPNDDQMNYPGEEHHYDQNPPIPKDQPPSILGSYTSPIANYPDMPPPTYPQPPERRKRPNAILILSIVIAVLVVAVGGLAYAFVSKSGTTTTQGTQQTTLGQAGGTPTSVSTQSSAPTAPSSTSTNYSAPQPGPGCDTNGGMWTPQGIGNITCGTQVAPAVGGTWGYLYLQLPNNETFSVNNKISVTGNLNNSLDCFGLAEQGANTGFLVTYCTSGAWSISSMSNKGIITQSLLNNITATKATTTLSLALSGNTLSFTIDSETHQTTVSPIQPIKVAIAYDFNNNCGNCSIPSIATNNFSYITPAS